MRAGIPWYDVIRETGLVIQCFYRAYHGCGEMRLDESL